MAQPAPSGTRSAPIIATLTPVGCPAAPAGTVAPEPHSHPPAGHLPPEPRVSVLVVDDQPANLLALEAVLADLPVDLVKAGSGFEALRCLLEGDFALILMDVKMPGMDGFETAELIRRRKRCRHTPIIFLTAVETADAQVFKGYALGAVDYLVKPIVPDVLRSKVAVFVDIFRKAEQIKRQAELLHRLEQREHQRQLAEVQAKWEAERLHQEIRIARQVQQMLFPAAPLPVSGLDIAGASFPAEATGGDYFDYIPTADGGVAVVVGDVCGHGFGPALVMAELRAYLRAFLLTRSDVGEVVRLLNRALAGDTDRFVTLLIAKIDPQTRGLSYAGAGHLPGYVFDTDGEVKARLESTGLPLAVIPDAHYTTEAAPPLQPGEVALLLTDGIVEAHGPEGELFGLDRVLRLVKAHRHRPAREILTALYDEVREFCGRGAQLDDMTAIVLKGE
jgi:serine phosphatase RsbU (regulator of sigma subunit)